MKAIERKLSANWEAGKPCACGNTTIAKRDNRLELILFGHVIAEKDLTTGKVSWSMAGWPTTTTRSRLRNVVGVNVWQHKFGQFADNKPIDPSAWYPEAA